jgi:hypothetical protein
LTRPLAIIHRRNQQLSTTSSRFLTLLTGEGDGETALVSAGGDGGGNNRTGH